MRRKTRQKRKFRRRLLFLILLGTLWACFYIWNTRSASIPLASLPPLPDGFHSYGVDVSHHQSRIDWETFLSQSREQIDFVYCKATEGEDHVDTQWNINQTMLQKMEVPHGAYHFFLPHKDPLVQAQHFLSHWEERQTDLPPALDVEIETVSDSELIQRMKIWLDHVEATTGLRPIIYTSYHLYQSKLKGAFIEYKFWIANYSSRSDRMKDASIIHWQFSENGRVPGIEGPVDLNYSKIRFR